MTLSRIVVIGGAQAGGNVAVGLRDQGYAGEVVVLGDEPDVPFGRPPLSKGYLRGEEDVADWMVKPADWYGDHDVSLRLGVRVERLDPSGGRVVLADGEEVRCDAACIATGCRPRPLSVAGADLDGVHMLRTRADADAIREAARAPGAKAVLVGMGFIGAEVAASLRRTGVDVTAVFPAGAPLAKVVGDRAGRAIAGMHRDHGVELIADDAAVSFRGNGRVEAVVTKSGRSFDCTFVVAGVGVEPNIEFLNGSGVAIDDGVLVDASCRTNLENVFAAGDVANHDHPVFGRLRVEHFNNAEKQARHVAGSMLGRKEPYDYVHSFWSDQYDEKIEYVGLAKEWDDFIVRGDVEGRSFLGFYLKDGCMKAAIGFNRGGDPDGDPDSDLAACGRLIRDGVPVDPCGLSDEDRPVASAGPIGRP